MTRSAATREGATRHLRHRRAVREVFRVLGSPTLAIGSLFFLSLAGSSLVGLAGGIADPRYHDEFSYVLQADTFARGRLANPSHPMGEHFESFHIIQRPTYASKYPPAQGALLALGRLAAGSAAAGAWIGAALMSATIVWMLLAWLPFRWAVVGGLVATLHFGIVGYWTQGYWGGSIATAGGALLFGSLRRLWGGPRAGPALSLAAGVVLLAASRPFEGLVVCVAVAALLGARWVRGSFAGWTSRFLLPAGMVLIGGAYVLTTHNAAVTGSRWTLPYSVHMDQYSVTPNFLIEEASQGSVSYSDARLARFHIGYERAMYDRQRSVSGYLSGLRTKAGVMSRLFAWGPPYVNVYFHWPSIVWLPLLLVPFALRGRPWMQVAAAVTGLLIATQAIVTYALGHYLAPVVPLLILLIAHGLRHAIIGMPRLRRRWDLWLGIYLVGVVVSLAVGVVIHAQLLSTETLWTNQRRAVVERLATEPGDDVVLVEYDPAYSIHQEWVYNSAEIDRQPIIWARSLGGSKDSVLRDYYARRTAWRLFLAPGEEPDLTRLPPP